MVILITIIPLLFGSKCCILLNKNNSLPILCTGDMNDIMHLNEKSGPGRPDLRRIDIFCDFVKQCGFIDLGYSGPAYTWTNKRCNTMPTFERLDRSLANAEWCTSYPNTIVYHLPMLRSDHAPILTLLNSSKRRTNGPFCFENWWLLEQGYEDVAKNIWHRSTRPFHQKVRYLATDLKKWRKAKPRLSDQLAQVEDQLLQEQFKPPNQQDHNLQQQLTDQHQQLLVKDEEFHHQRAKKNWVMLGDRNTSYFHQTIVKWTRKNRITYLIDQDGCESTTQEHLSHTLIGYFCDIFSSQSPTLHTPSNTHCMLNTGNRTMIHNKSRDVSNQTSLQQSTQQDFMAFTDSKPTIQELYNIVKR